jgi:hypothetical protein
VNEIADFIEMASREFNQLSGSHRLEALAGVLVATVALVAAWIHFYRREARKALGLGLAAAALIGVGTWWFLGWLGPHEGCLFQGREDHPPPGSTRAWVALLAAAIPAALVLLREPVRKIRGDGAWGFLTLFTTILFAGLLIGMLGLVGISTSVVLLEPPAHWPGLELFPRDVYYLDRIPVYVDYNTIGLIVVLTLVVSFVFSIYPALKAASYDPIEAIRDE